MANNFDVASSQKDGCEGERLFPEFPPATYEEWHREAVASLKGAPFEKRLITKTYEEIDLQPMYWASDTEGIPHMSSLPGFSPFVRGSEPGGYVLKPWDICQEIACSTPEEFNEVARHELARGQNALKVVLDSPSRKGLDPDDEKATATGGNGLSLATVGDLNTALRGIDLRVVPLTIHAGAIALPLLLQVSIALEDQGMPPAELQGCIGADPLGELATEGSLSIRLETAYKSMACVARWAKEYFPRLQTILVHGCPYHDAGGSAVQELAYAMGTAVEYLRELSKRGLSIEEIVPQMRFVFSLGPNFFMEIAKLRAARLVWAQVVEAFGGSPENQKMMIHARTSARTKTACDPYVNMLRNTTEAFSGAMGGVDSMQVCPFDEPIRPADEFSRRVSRNLQIVLQKEAHIVQPIDAAGGSWYIEKLTDSMARKAWNVFREVEAQGGMVGALQKGIPQSAVSNTAAGRSKNVDTRRDVVVGVNMYPNLREIKLQKPSVDYEELGERRASQLQAHRLRSDLFRFYEQLGQLSIAFGEDASDIPAKGMEAVRSGATLGDLWAFLSVNGVPGPSIQPLHIHRTSERFESLRSNAEHILARKGARPKVFLANMGVPASFKARADFSTAFFEVGGFEVLGTTGFGNAEDAARAALASGAGIIAICSTDQAYPEVVPPLARIIKEERPDAAILLAGRPAPELEPVFREAGVDDFFFMGINCYELLSVLQKRS